MVKKSQVALGLSLVSVAFVQAGSVYVFESNLHGFSDRMHQVQRDIMEKQSKISEEAATIQKEAASKKQQYEMMQDITALKELEDDTNYKLKKLQRSAERESLTISSTLAADIRAAGKEFIEKHGFDAVQFVPNEQNSTMVVSKGADKTESFAKFFDKFSEEKAEKTKKETDQLLAAALKPSKEAGSAAKSLMKKSEDTKSA